MGTCGFGKKVKVGYGPHQAFFLSIIKILQEFGLIWVEVIFLENTTFLMFQPRQVGMISNKYLDFFTIYDNSLGDRWTTSTVKMVI